MAIKRTSIDFAVAAKEYTPKQLNAQTCKNWYGVYDETAKFKNVLFPFPGSLLWSDDGGTHKAVRGMYSLNGNFYGIVDDEFRIYNDTGEWNKIGTLNTGEGFVKFMANDNQIFLTDYQNGYVYQLVTTTTRTKGDFFRIANASSFIGKAVFGGSGLNDMTALGIYTGESNKTYRIEIDGNGTPNTFRWSNDAGVTWEASAVPITAVDQILENGVQVVFSHANGHTLLDYWTVQVTIDSAFYPPIIPIYLDSYGIFPKANTQRFYLSSSEDFSVINALDYSSTNAFPDNIVCGVALNEEIVFIGTCTTEIWYDTGLSPFPLQRRPNLLLNWGTSAPYSLAWASNNAIFWLAQSVNGGRVVVMMSNYNVQVISDPALNEKLQNYAYVDDAFGFVCEWTGKIFYFLTIPSADITWVYDFDAKAWRQRTTLRASEDLKKQDYKEGRYLANCHVYHNGEHYIGDWKSGNIYKMSNTYFKDGSLAIINEAITPPLHIDANRVSVYSLQPVLEAATGLVSGQGTEPTVMLQYSTDGGYTWSSEMWRTHGKVGEYDRRAKWDKLGYGRQTVFKIRISDPVYKVLMGAIVELEDTGS